MWCMDVEGFVNYDLRFLDWDSLLKIKLIETKRYSKYISSSLRFYVW